MQRSRRWLIFVFAMAGVGALLNVGVAWILTAVTTLDPSKSPAVQGESVTGWHYPSGRGIDESVVGVIQLLRRGGRERVAAGYVAGTVWDQGALNSQDLEFVPRWANGALDVALPLAAPAVWHVVDASGWPMMALQSRVIASCNGSVCEANIRGGIPFASPPTTPEAMVVTTAALPITPILPGFFINTIVYGVIAGILILLWRRTLRVVRGKRGCCVRCGHCLGPAADRCPECGAH